MIQVLSASWCNACSTVKQFLAANKIKFVERDIDDDPEAKEIMNRLKLRSIPVVYIDDDNFVIGSDYKKIMMLVDKA
jgi:glutaredoxin